MLDVLQVFVRVVFVLRHLNLIHRNVGAVVGYALEVGGNIGQHEAQLDGALAGGQPLDVAGFDVHVDVVDARLQRLHRLCQFYIIMQEAVK